MRSFGAKALHACAAFTVLSSCAMYRPRNPIPTTYRSQILADVSNPNLLQNYNAMPDGNGDQDPLTRRKLARRNQILQELITLVDQNYEQFENRYYGSDASVNFAGDVVNLGLTGVSSVTGTAHLKTVLSAIATGATGIKTSYLKNFYDQQTRSAVVEKMRALRAEELATLQDANHMKAGVTQYSLEQGLSDIDAYYNKGTITGALQDIATKAGQQETDAQTKQNANSRQRQKFQ